MSKIDLVSGVPLDRDVVSGVRKDVPIWQAFPNWGLPVAATSSPRTRLKVRKATGLAVDE